MFTRRMLLKRGGCAVLATAAAPMLISTARAQTAPFDFYIGPSGSDSNAGTLASPWAITAINSKRSSYAGKRVGLLSGTYNVYALCQAANWNAPALAIAGGTSGSPTLIAAVNPRQAILTGANPSGGGYPTKEAGPIGQGDESGLSSYGNVIIDGLYITRCYQFGIVFYLDNGGAGGEGGAQGIEIRNCEVYDIGGNDNDNVSGIFFQNCTGAWVHNNKIHSVQPPTAAGENAEDVAGIYSYYCTGNVYEYNTIYDCNQGIRDKFTTNGNHTYRYNYIECNGSSPQSAIYDGGGGKAGDKAIAYNNILVCASGGGWVAEAWNAPSSQSVQFYNNTVIYGPGCTGFFYPAGGKTISPSAMVTHYNNIYHITSGLPEYTGVVCFPSGSVALSDYNLYDSLILGTAFLGMSTVANTGVPTLYTLANWRGGFGLDAHSAAANPSFVSPTALNPAGYKLQSGSAGSAGSSSPGSTTGASGGAACDMGAWGGATPPTQIGCNFGPVPDPPVIISVS